MVDRAEKVLMQIKKQYNENPNIVGFSIGYKERKDTRIQRCAVKVYVKNKLKEVDLDSALILPKMVDGIAIDVVQRKFDLQQDPFDNYDPLLGGICVANTNNDGDFGTLGAIVEDMNDFSHYILSNWHVLYGRDDATEGETIVQPDAGAFNDVAETVAGVFNQLVDCALAKSNNGRGHERALLDLVPALNGHLINVSTGTRVRKSGVNGLAVGEVTGVKASHEFTMPWNGNQHEMLEQLEISAIDGEPFHMDAGDSGSLWITDEDEPKVVGLHFAGETNQRSLANPINTVLEHLNDLGYEIIF